MSRIGDAEDATDGLRRRLRPVAFHCLVWSLVFVTLLPLLWPVMLSLNEVRVGTLLDRGLLWWLEGVSFGAFLYTLSATPFLRLLGNSTLVATVSALLSAALAATAAYGIDRFEFAGRRLVAGFLLVFLMVPSAVVAIPLFLNFRTLGLYDTRIGLVLAYLAFTLPFTTWFLIAYFSEIPPWLEEAAMVDGCTRAGAFARAFLPTARPALAGAFTFAWMLAYNEFLFASVLIHDPAKRTLPVGITYGVGPPGVVSVLASLPMLALFAFLWRYLLSDDVDRFRN